MAATAGAATATAATAAAISGARFSFTRVKETCKPLAYLTAALRAADLVPLFDGGKLAEEVPAFITFKIISRHNLISFHRDYNTRRPTCHLRYQGYRRLLPVKPQPAKHG